MVVHKDLKQSLCLNRMETDNALPPANRPMNWCVVATLTAGKPSTLPGRSMLCRNEGIQAETRKDLPLCHHAHGHAHVHVNKQRHGGTRLCKASGQFNMHYCIP